MIWRKISGSSSEKVWLMAARTRASNTSFQYGFRYLTSSPIAVLFSPYAFDATRWMSDSGEQQRPGLIFSSPFSGCQRRPSHTNPLSRGDIPARQIGMKKYKTYERAIV